jgi:hypothetical protein
MLDNADLAAPVLAALALDRSPMQPTVEADRRIRLGK